MCEEEVLRRMMWCTRETWLYWFIGSIGFGAKIEFKQSDVPILNLPLFTFLIVQALTACKLQNKGVKG